MNKTAFAALALLAASSAFAGTNLVTNGSFEEFSGITSSAAWGQTSNVNGWTSIANIDGQGADALEIQKVGGQSDFSQISYDGSHYLELNANRLGAVSQTLTTQAGQTYTLTFGYADRASSNGASSIQVWWNGSLLDTVSTDSASWTTYTNKVIGTGSDVLKFVSTGPTASASYGSYLDGVSVTAVAAPVPEPESYAMLLAGLGLMATVARRRKSARS